MKKKALTVAYYKIYVNNSSKDTKPTFSHFVYTHTHTGLFLLSITSPRHDAMAESPSPGTPPEYSKRK